MSQHCPRETQPEALLQPQARLVHSPELLAHSSRACRLITLALLPGLWSREHCGVLLVGGGGHFGGPRTTLGTPLKLPAGQPRPSVDGSIQLPRLVPGAEEQPPPWYMACHRAGPGTWSQYTPPPRRVKESGCEVQVFKWEGRAPPPLSPAPMRSGPLENNLGVVSACSAPPRGKLTQHHLCSSAAWALPALEADPSSRAIWSSGFLTKHPLWCCPELD